VSRFAKEYKLIILKMPSKMTPYKRKIMKEDLRDAGESTTGHVIPLIVKSRYLPMKIFLFVVWLTGVALTIVLITYSIIDFFKYEVTTKTRYMRESPMLFPKVTICNNDPFPTLAAVTFLANLFRTDAVFTNNLAKADAEGVDTNDDINLVNWFITKENDDEIEFLSKAMTKALQSDETTKRSLGYDQGTFIQDCVFDEKNCSDKFTHSYDIGFGNCFTFNADKTFSSKKSGKLQLYLT